MHREMTSQVAATLPPLLPTPAHCLLLAPPPAVYTARVELDSKKQQPGRASMSRSWIRDKVDLPGRASGSSSWITDKTLRRAETLDGGVERLGRVGTPREKWKRPASRAPSIDRCEKKLRPPTEMLTHSEASLIAGPVASVDWSEKKTTPLTDRSEQKPKPLAKMEATSEASFFAGPTFILSPDPSELPMPTFLYKQAQGH
ncbi:hypothetical protein ZWY2020_014700 [Hordeum vulgare]|nr:hypothetical protein ZWY2020_014700 [Hordeum vulgare]